MAETEPNYTISRGKIIIDGRYVGNSPQMRFVYKSASRTYHIHFKLDDISLENLELFFGGKRRVSFEYVAHNAVGQNIDFQVTGDLMPDDFPFKEADWQGMSFMLSFDKPPAFVKR